MRSKAERKMNAVIKEKVKTKVKVAVKSRDRGDG
jgi:hypothetical protein